MTQRPLQFQLIKSIIVIIYFFINVGAMYRGKYYGHLRIKFLKKRSYLIIYFFEFFRIAQELMILPNY